MDVDLLLPAILLVPATAIIILVVAIGLLARDADDDRGRGRRWGRVALIATGVLVAWSALFVLIYSQAASS
jgi:hypothetical protein